MNPQLAPNGNLQHLLTLDGLPKQTLCRLLDRAGQIRDTALGRTHKRDLLVDTTICTLFFEPSTRTRSSFQIAAQRLGADIINFDASTSSARKGETALDTMKNLEAMGVRGFVVRHPEDGAAGVLAAQAGEGTRIINAGDGRSAHPTQGLLDMLTVRQAKGPDFSKLKFLIVGDVKHSRVARSDLHALRTLEAGEVRVCGPAPLLPDDATLRGCKVGDDFDTMLKGVDVVMMLRLQRERMEEGLVSSLDGYRRAYGLTAARLRRAARDAVVMHPGPVNRGVEMTDEVMDGPQSLVLRQVSNGVAIRMAVLEALLA
jgi:aspartate carbamoyltransferase catalytic subunit